ncbi:MAG: hypothetical protein ACE5FS_08065 [Paracoccaceae bacterium]
MRQINALCLALAQNEPYRTRRLGRNEGPVMPFEDLKVKISMLLEQMVNQPDDIHEAQEMLREKLQEIRGFGMPLPDDLVALEKQMEEILNRQAKK